MATEPSRLKPCPEKPNCVLSTEENGRHAVSPLLTYGVSSEKALKELKNIISNMPNTKLLTEDKNYLHFSFTSKIFGFVDDVEFEMLSEEGPLHVRSASRWGYSDLGANSKRVEKISKAFERSIKKNKL